MEKKWPLSIYPRNTFEEKLEDCGLTYNKTRSYCTSHTRPYCSLPSAIYLLHIFFFFQHLYSFLYLFSPKRLVLIKKSGRDIYYHFGIKLWRRKQFISSLFSFEKYNFEIFFKLFFLCQKNVSIDYLILKILPPLGLHSLFLLLSGTSSLETPELRLFQPSEYPFLSHVPKTSFDCKKHSVGYFADTDPATRCQVYHMCDMKGNKFSYLCPNGTLFHQQLLICAHWYQVNCTKAVQLYEVNKLMFPYERFKPDPTDRLHKHERPALQPPNVLAAEESSTFESSRQITKRPFPPFQQFRQFPREILKSELQTQQTNIVETVVNKFQPQSTTEFFSTTELFSTTNPATEVATDVSDTDDTTVDPSLFHSTPWWSQFDPHNLPAAPTLRPETISRSITPKATQLETKTPENKHNSKIIIKSDEFGLKFPKLGDSNLLIDLPVNDKCPLCHPHFIQDGHCSPCVVIRR